MHENTRFWLDVCFSREVEASGLTAAGKKVCVRRRRGGIVKCREFSTFEHP